WTTYLTRTATRPWWDALGNLRASQAPAFALKALRRGLAVALAEAETERAGEAASERAGLGVRGAKPLGCNLSETADGYHRETLRKETVMAVLTALVVICLVLGTLALRRRGATPAPRLVGVLVMVIIVGLFALRAVRVIPAGHVGVEDLFGRVAPETLKSG